MDLCERSLVRMKNKAAADGKTGVGSLIGISSPGCNATQAVNRNYSMEGSGEFLFCHGENEAVKQKVDTKKELKTCHDVLV